MKKWVIVDDATTAMSRIDKIVTDAENKADAIKLAQNRLAQLTDIERAQRNAFFIGLADVERENGQETVNLDTMTDREYFKGPTDGKVYKSCEDGKLIDFEGVVERFWLYAGSIVNSRQDAKEGYNMEWLVRSLVDERLPDMYDPPLTDEEREKVYSEACAFLFMDDDEFYSRP